MNIGEAAARSGVPAKTIRYYEDIGLIRPQARGMNGYRVYGDPNVQQLRFIKRARRLGFSVEDCRSLLSLYEDRGRASADVKGLALERIAEIDAKLAELQQMRLHLTDLIEQCRGDEWPDCPILEDLAGS